MLGGGGGDLVEGLHVAVADALVRLGPHDLAAPGWRVRVGGGGAGWAGGARTRAVRAGHRARMRGVAFHRATRKCANAGGEEHGSSEGGGAGAASGVVGEGGGVRGVGA